MTEQQPVQKGKRRTLSPEQRELLEYELRTVGQEVERLARTRTRLDASINDVVAQALGTVLGGVILAVGAAGFGLVGHLSSATRIALGICLVVAVVALLRWWRQALRAREQLFRRYLDDTMELGLPTLFRDDPESGEAFVARLVRRQEADDRRL